MKKILLTAALLGAVTCSYAQGVVNWANNATTFISTNSIQGAAATGVTAPVAGSYVYALFWAPSTVTTVTGIGDANWTFAGVYGTNQTTTTGGRYGGGFNTLGGANPPAAGATVNLLVRGWSANVAGRDWTAVVSWYNALPNGEANVAVTGWYGQSGVASGVSLGGGTLPIPGIYGTLAGNIGGWTLGRIDPVPEPTTFALVGLGAAALVIFRRRN